MSLCSVPIPYERPAAKDLRARISAAARWLGVADPLKGLEDLFAHTFARPKHDPGYRGNQLQPSALPLEWSFSELDPYALRIELQPFDPGLAPQQRLKRTVAALLPVVVAHYGASIAAQFSTRIRHETADSRSPSRFGAFLGLAFRPHSAPEFKIYLEPDLADKRLWSDGGPDIDGAVPHFRSVAVGGGIISERSYFLCQNGLRLSDLETLCTTLGIPHRFPALVLTALELTGGKFYLPGRSALLGIRRTTAYTELKLELVAGPALNSIEVPAQIERLLDPSSVVLYRRWAAIVRPPLPRELPLSIVSIRATAGQPIRLSVYAAEPEEIA